MNTTGIEVRSVEDSLRHAHDAVSRAETLVARMMTDLTAKEQGPEVTHEAPYDGIVGSADRLAGRVESLVRDLERVRSRLVDSGPKEPASKGTIDLKWSDPNTVHR